MGFNECYVTASSSGMFSVYTTVCATVMLTPLQTASCKHSVYTECLQLAVCKGVSMTVAQTVV